MGLFSEFKMLSGSLSGMREFLKGTISVEESIEEMKRRLESREENFLLMLEWVYDNKKSPYYRIFKAVGYEFKDIKSLVDSSGLEGTLTQLANEGAYVTIEEFKGKREWVRKGKRIHFSESDFDNIFTGGFEMTTGGTRSQGTRVQVDFKRTLERCYNSLFADYVLGLTDYPGVIWLPGPLAQQVALINFKTGVSIAGCYSQTVEVPSLNIRNAYPTIKRTMLPRIMMYEARLLGARMHSPEFVDLNNCTKIAKQVASIMREHSGCFLRSFSSSGVRVCNEAEKMGLEIDGVVIECSGEPITPTRRREMENVGAKVVPFYAASETGVIAKGCYNHKHCDDMHVFRDSLAIIQYKRQIKDFGISVDSFLITSLLEHASKIMINVEIGDHGVLKSESCSCGYGKFGFNEKIYDVRSFEKLTGEGMTLIGSDMIDVIEEDLPAMFGGSSTEYQVVEDEDDKGFTHMDILVSPRLGEVDEKRVVDAVYDGLRRRSKGRNLSFEMWEDVGTIRVRRERPIVTKRGKILSFQIQKKRG